MHKATAPAHERPPPPGGYCIIYRLDPDTNDNSTAGDVLVLRVFGPGQSRDAL